MTSFPDELYKFLVELECDIFLPENKTPFVLLKDRISGITVQAISTAAYNDLDISPSFFRAQSEWNESAGQRLIHCWEDLWYSRQEIVKSRLGSLFGKSIPIHGRACKIIRPRESETKRFLEENHLIGAARGKYCYGLNYKSNLVALALFGRSVPVQRDGITYQSHEMIRFCSLRGHYVQGGLSRLIRAFIREVNPEDIYTAIDRDWSDGNAFHKLGFDIIGFTDPLRFWLDDAGHRHRTPPGPGAPEVTNAGNIQYVLTLKDA